MRFDRITVLEKEQHPNDRIVEQRKNDALRSDNTPHKRIFFMLPDMGGAPASLKKIADKLLEQLPDASCMLIRKNCNAPLKFDPKAFGCNAAYVRYLDRLVYFNNETNEVSYVYNRYLAQFDDTLKVRELAFDVEHVLTDEQLYNIVLKTTHIHERKTPILIYSDTRICQGAYQGEEGFNLLQQEYFDIWTLMNQYKVDRPFIIAYSYSTLLAIEILQHLYLIKYNKKCDAFLIDGPSPTVSMKFLENQSTEPGKYWNTVQYVDNIINIANYCGRLASNNNLVAHVDDETKEYLQTCEPGKCFEEVTKIMKGDTKDEVFDRISNFVKQRLQRVAKFEKEKEIIKPMENVTLEILLTDTTKRLYEDFSPDSICGWENFAEQMKVVGYDQNADGSYVRNPKTSAEETLLKASHQSLSQSDEHAELVAASIVNCANRIDNELLQQQNKNYMTEPALPSVSAIIESNQARVYGNQKRAQAHSPNGSPPNNSHRFFPRLKPADHAPAITHTPRYVSPMKSGGGGH